jgi:hypothetical protein
MKELPAHLYKKICDMKNFKFSPLDQEYSAGVRFRIPALQECGKDSFLLYIKKPEFTTEVKDLIFL